MLGTPSSFLCFLFLLILLFSTPSSSAPPDDTVVMTSSGPIKGKHLAAGSGSVTAYLGIPYAEPPLGKLRFQKPLPHKPWSQTLEATSFGNSCPQYLFLDFPDAAVWLPQTPLSEDCLFLNVWVPRPRPSSPAPILFWIHGGGGFLIGSASVGLYNGASLAATENVIVVSINYRLGALGFLSLPPASPGNMGLWDQHLALRWIRENAAAFGGDPNQVTILGQNSGAVSVGLHLLSPHSGPLFARAVLQSGAANVAWAWMNPEKAKQKALVISQRLGCAEGNEHAVVRCLQEKDAADFTQHELSMVLESKFILDLPFLPTTDGEFLTDDPEKLLGSGHIQVKPTLIGVTSDEASTFLPYLFPNTTDGLITWDQLLKGIRMTLQRATEEDIEAVAQKYSEGDPGPARYRSALSRAILDYSFLCPVAEFAAKSQESGSPVYVYSFAHHTSGSVFPEWIGAPHGAELPYVFGTLESAVGVNQTYTEAEAALSRRMMRYWAEFSRSGKPTGSGAKEKEWPLYDATEQNFFRLTTDSPQATQISLTQKCGFLKTHSLKPDADIFISLKKTDIFKKSWEK
nr:cholinesterase-like isoform X1 [Pogona vitticeps]